MNKINFVLVFATISIVAGKVCEITLLIMSKFDDLRWLFDYSMILVWHWVAEFWNVTSLIKYRCNRSEDIPNETRASQFFRINWNFRSQAQFWPKWHGKYTQNTNLHIDLNNPKFNTFLNRLSLNIIKRHKLDGIWSYSQLQCLCVMLRSWIIIPNYWKFRICHHRIHARCERWVLERHASAQHTIYLRILFPNST